MNKLCVSLFGKFSVAYNDEVIDSFHINKVQELFGYLMIQRRPHSRDTLAELLWNNVSTHQSKSYLRKVLWQLQIALSAFTNPTTPFLQIQADCIHLNPTADYWLDVATFEDTFNRVRGVSGQQLHPHQAQELETAVVLYQGDLLEGWYQEWCLYERERFQQMLLMILDKLMGYAEKSGDYETGLTHGSRILSYDPARERTHCKLMRLHYLNGDRTEALRQYERCKAILHKELGVAPTEQTVALYEQMRREQPTRLPTSLSTHPPVSPALSLMELLDHLKQFQTHLVSMQCQVELDIDIVEKYLQTKQV